MSHIVSTVTNHKQDKTRIVPWTDASMASSKAVKMAAPLAVQMVALTDETTAASMVESTAVLTVARKVAMMAVLKAG